MVSGEECVYVEGRSVEFVFLGFLLLEYFSKKCSLKIFVFFFNLKGMTEGGGVTTLQNDKRKSTDSVGFVVPNVKVKIVDLENGKAVGPNKEGELCIKSNNFMLGYYKNPQATAEAIDEDGC